MLKYYNHRPNVYSGLFSALINGSYVDIDLDCLLVFKIKSVDPPRKSG